MKEEKQLILKDLPTKMLKVETSLCGISMAKSINNGTLYILMS